MNQPAAFTTKPGVASVLLVLVLLVLVVVPSASGFQSLSVSSNHRGLQQKLSHCLNQWQPRAISGTSTKAKANTFSTRQYLFGRDNDENKDEGGNDDDNKKSTPSTEKEDAVTSKSGGGIPFFSRFLRKDEQETTADSSTATTNLASDTTTKSSSEQPSMAPATTTAVMEKPAPAPVKQPRFEDLTPLEQAKMLRAQAEKARLEAERMDAELTLEKISRLERELAHAKKVSLTNNVTAQTEVESLMRELEVLQAKMRGETVSSVVKPTTAKANDMASQTSAGKSTATTRRDDPPKGDYFSRLPEFQEDFDEEVYQGVLDEVTKSPEFMKKAMAAQVGVDYSDAESLNTTEVALRLDKMSRFDFSFGGYQRPSFTQDDIDDMKKQLRSNNMWANGMSVDPRLQNLSAGNETEWALMALEFQYFMQKYSVGEEELTSFVEEDEIFGELISQFNISAVDSTIDNLYPKCTRKEGEEPTQAEVNQLMTEVLPKAKFTTTAKPEKVLGGYVIRGNSKSENGDDLIQAIDEQLAKTSLGEKMTVLYTRDFTVFTSDGLDDDTIDLPDMDPILYVVGPNIVREPRRVLLSLTSGLGLATCWYLSLYPFLLNPTIASRVDEELALVDAGMTPDLSWLTDLSVPLFATFIGIQLMHEAGHRLVAAFNGVS